MNTRTLMHGITLVEMLVVIVIIAILAAVAYPNYTEFMARAKRTEAKGALLQIATNQERFYLNNRNFTQDLVVLGLGDDVNTYRTDSGAYDVTVNNADASSWDATATFLQGGAEAGKCLTFTIDSTGDRGSAPDTDCWTRSR